MQRPRLTSSKPAAPILIRCTGAALEKSNSYFEGGYWLILWGAVVGFLIDFLIFSIALVHRAFAPGQNASVTTPQIGGTTWLTHHALY